VHRLRQANPTETISLLELILNDGPGPYREPAIELIRKLREKQCEVVDLVRRAHSAAANANLSDEITTWRMLLDQFPDHAEAKQRYEEALRLRDLGMTARHESVLIMDTGEFSRVRDLIERARAFTPGETSLISLASISRRREDAYSRAIADVQVALADGKVATAREHVTDALAQAPNSQEALELQSTANALWARAEQYLNDAEQALIHADFALAKRCLRNARRTACDHPRIVETRNTLRQTEHAHAAARTATRDACQTRDLAAALRAAEDAVRTCPDSPEAREALDTVKAEMDRARQLLAEARVLIRAADFAAAALKLKAAEEIWPHVAID